MDPGSWRALWRRRGLAVDRLLPKLFCVPSPELQDLKEAVPKRVNVPSGGVETLRDGDADVAHALIIQRST